jgi:hypothetical protein
VTRTAPLRTPRPDSAETPATAEYLRPEPDHNAPRRTRSVLKDATVIVAYLAFAIWLLHGLLADPNGRALDQNPADQTLYEWFLSYDTHFWNGDFSLVTDRLNSPQGVNLLANTTVIALGVLFTPVTLLLGTGTTFAIIVVLNLAGTAAAWYVLFRRTLRADILAAAVGAAFCGFAPGMISQSNAHLHITAQWLVPAIVWAVLRIWQAPERKIKYAAILALLVSAQVLIGEETLFLTALTLLIVVAAYAVITRPPLTRIREFLAGMGIAILIATALLAYPLWTQFAGRQSVPDGPFSPSYFFADLASFPAFSPLSAAGSTASLRLSTGYTELNTFLGWPLLLVTVAAVIWLRRNAVAVACGIAALIMSLLSLGPEIVVAGHHTGIPGPFRLLKGLPLVNGALPMRFALVAVPLIAVVLVLLLRVRQEPQDAGLRSTSKASRFGIPLVVLASLVPLLPMPLPTTQRPAIPRFYSEGYWRSCAPEGGVIVPVPLATPPAPEPMRYAVATRVAFSMPEGFFIGPYSPGGRAAIGALRRPTALLLADVEKTGRVRDVNDTDRAVARMDFHWWRADCIAVTDSPHRQQLEETLERLLQRPGETIADATVWRVP